MIDYNNLEEKISELVKRISAEIVNRDFDITIKTSLSDIVTTMDIKVQNFLQQELKKLIPFSGFLCEEKNIKDVNREYVWIIDPIDGTTNYARGLSEYAVSIALIHNGQPVLAVVYNPAQKELYSAIADRGARLNGKPIRVSDKSFESSLLCTAMSVYHKEYAPKCFEIISKAYNLCNDVRRFGSCAMELCYVAAGKCDLYFEYRVFPWDYAGGYLILKEAGGILKGWNGEELSFDKPTVLVGANNEENYQKLNNIVNSYIKEVPYNEDL